MNTEQYLKRHHKCKKVVTFQNIKFFMIPSLKYEAMGEKTIVWGRKKKKHSKSKCAGYEKVAIMLRNWYPTYTLGLMVAIAWLLYLKL